MRRLQVAVLGLATLTGCTGVNLLDLLGGGPGIPETGSSKLLPFGSEKELLDYFADQVNAQNARSFEILPFLQFGDDVALGGSGSLDASSPTAPPSAVTEDGDQARNTDFSQTTIQEEGVDESDVVKTDGDFLYIMDEGVVKIVSISDRNRMQVVSSTPIEGFGQELYLYEKKIVAVTSTFGGFFPLPIIDPLLPAPGPGEDVAYERPSTIVTIVDVADPASPVVMSSTKFEGTQSASRMIDGVLHFVVANFQYDYVDILPMFDAAVRTPASVDASVVLPTFERTDADGTTSSDVVTWREVYRPTDPDGYGLVTLISLDVDDDASFTGVGVVAAPGLIYASLDALYLTDTQYNFAMETRETTDIYKFAFEERRAVARATGSVPGRVLNQYSMSEHNGFLRVATTVRGAFSPLGVRPEPTNSVFVLEELEDGLSVAGSVENIAPGETIQSARFIGDRGYLVTFREIDPFFTLDLADPTSPQIVGELKIPGFSTFLVPMDESHILAVGQYIPEGDPFLFGQGVQLSIFDVTDFANPALSAQVVLGEDSYAYSEALYNPKAFSYFRDRELLALPVTIEEGSPFVDVVFTDPDEPTVVDGGDVPPDETLLVDAVIPARFDGMIIYSVNADSGFEELGRIDTKLDDPMYYGAAFQRGVFVGTDVLAVTDRVIRGAPVTEIETLPYEATID